LSIPYKSALLGHILYSIVTEGCSNNAEGEKRKEEALVYIYTMNIESMNIKELEDLIRRCDDLLNSTPNNVIATRVKLKCEKLRNRKNNLTYFLA